MPNGRWLAFASLLSRPRGAVKGGYCVAVGFGVLSIVGVAACGSSSNGSGSSATTTTAKPSQDISADKTAAQAASLVLSDFPAGWTAKPRTSGDAESAQSELTQVAKCLGVSESELADAPVKYSSPQFSQKDLSTSSTVEYRATSAEQDRSFDILTSPKTPNCLATTVKNVLDETLKNPSSSEATLPAGASIGTPTVSQLSFPRLGDKSTAYQVKIPGSYLGVSSTFVVDLVYVTKGRANVGMDFESVGNSFPIDQQQHYTQVVVNRLKDT